MPRVTYFVVNPFARNDEGALIALEPVECRSANTPSLRPGSWPPRRYREKEG